MCEYVEWKQGKRTRAINRYKKDLRQAEEELQQLHFHEQPGGLHNTGIKAQADPSTQDDCVWEYYADIINRGDYRTAPDARRLRAAGDEHSSHSDEELLASLPNTYFKPVKCSEEEDTGHPDTQQRSSHPLPQRPVRKPSEPADVPPTGRTAQNIVHPDPVPVLRHPRAPKTEAACELSRSQDDSSDESAAESSRRERALGARRRTMGLVCLFTSYMRTCLLYTSPSPRDGLLSRMPSSA